ncbi:MAG TPA: NAD(P)/FAD-dependent oxidoreductase [Bacteroidia bacterium]|nr:NAD(P)/FAD-dependent oxidoreductase [Bacteroidia bacterium]
MKTEKVDVLVIGAGPAGSIAAALLNKQGFKIKIVEKEIFPRFVIGESLLPRVMDHLDEAGLLERIKAEKFQEKFGAKFVRGDEICDFNFADQFSDGWKWTWQVPRAQFDKVMADEVARQGVSVEYGSVVSTIEFNATQSVTTVVKPKGGEKKVEARFIVDASGYGRVIPRMFNLDKPSNFEARRSHFVHFTDGKRPGGIDGNRITVIVHEKRTWIWIIPFSNGTTSVGYVGDPQFYYSLPKDPVHLMRKLCDLNENTSERFKDEEMVMEPRSIEGYAISTKKLYGDGFVLCGNATEFLDPVFSSGVTFAMESGNRAAKLVTAFLNDKSVDWERDYTQYMLQGINTFRSYVTGWYDGSLHDIFFSKTTNPEIKQQICSVLAGYVWDLDNPFVKKHEQLLQTLSKVIRIESTIE